jgi:hypothetical protein
MGCKAWRLALLTTEGGTPLFLCWGCDHQEQRSVGIGWAIAVGEVCRLQLLVLLILFVCILPWLLLFYVLQRLERFLSHSLILSK